MNPAVTGMTEKLKLGKPVRIKFNQYSTKCEVSTRCIFSFLSTYT